MRIEFLRPARAELYRAADWYDRREPGRSNDFYNEVQNSFKLMREFPAAQPSVGGKVRRILVKRYPYALVYAPTHSDVLTIIAVAHTKRNPGYWRRRLKKLP
jgi:plasmid stabilization system protein ParE